jgi:hypothetical protein
MFARAKSRVFVACGNKQDHTDDVKAAHRRAIAEGADLFFGAGLFRIRGWSEVLEHPVRWIGDPETEIKIEQRSLEFMPNVSCGRLMLPAMAGTRVIKVEGINAKAGCLIHLEAAVVADQVRKEPIIAQSFMIESVVGDEITLDRALNFTFYPGDKGIKVLYFRSSPEFEFKSIKFLSGITNVHRRSLTITGFLNSARIESCSFDGGNTIDANSAFDGILIQQSIGVSLFDLNFVGCRYGITISRGARNISGGGLHSYRCRHAVNPAFWAYECYFNDIMGIENFGTIDCHSSFNINYNNVKALSELSVSDFRSAGGSLTNVNMTFHETANINPILLAYQKFTPRVSQDKRIVSIKDVNINYGSKAPRKFISFYIGDGADVFFKNVRTEPGGFFISSSPFSSIIPTIESSNVDFKSGLNPFSA